MDSAFWSPGSHSACIIVQVRLQAFDLQICPDGAQRRWICRFAGCRRFVFNEGLKVQRALRDFDQSYRNFFEGRASAPKLNRKGRHDRFRYPQGIRLDPANARVFLPKIGWVRLHRTARIACEVSGARGRQQQESAEENLEAPKASSAVGIPSLSARAAA